MVDMTAKLFWYRTKEWYENMADKLNDIVYTDDSKETVDVINLLLLGWILLGLIVYIIGTVIANQLRKRKATFSSGETDISPDGKLSESTERVSCVKPDATKLSSENLEKTVIPTCSGDEQEIVDWVNSVFLWIYRNRVISPILTAWVSALNARTRLLSTEHGILIDFKDVTLTCGSPEIQEVMETCSTRGDLNVKCNMEIENISFDITVTQVKERDKTVTPFLLNVKKIFGKVNIECNPEDLSFVAKYSEAPEVELSAETVQNATENVENQEALNSVVCEICSEAFSSAIVDLKLSCYSECPRLVLKSVDSEEEVESIQTTKNEAEEKLLVKIIKASNLGGNEGCIQPYCVVEMDEPPQKFETKALQEKFNPFWDESFTFCVKDISAELLFEIYDKGKPSKENFLGLGIVSVDELIQNPSQRQIIPLQSRPLEDDYVTGSLTTEFLFLSHIIPITETTHLSPKTVASNGKSVETNSRVTAGGTIITTTTIKRTKEGMSDNDDYCYDIDNNECSSEQVEKTNTILFAAPVIKPVHEHSKEFMHKKNKHVIYSDFSNSTKIDACNEANSINTYCLNGVALSVGNTDVNSEIQDGSVGESGEIFASMEFNFADNVQNYSATPDSLLSNKKTLAFPVPDTLEKLNLDKKQSLLKDRHDKYDALFQNGESKIACPPFHAHEKVSSILKQDSVESDINHSNTFLSNEVPHIACPPLCEEQSSSAPFNTRNDCIKSWDNFENKPEMNDCAKLHEIVKPLFLMNDLNPNCDESSTLPTIVETRESNSTSSKSDKDIEADLTGTALKELEKQSKPKNSTSKSTLIIHSVQRADSSFSESLEASPASHLSKDSRTSYSESVPSSPSEDKSGDDRSRSKEKKSLFGSLRRRLSFRKARSKSAENRSEPSNYSQGSSRSASSDRLRSRGQKPSPIKGKFMGMKFLAVPGSTRSSLSEVSGISASSSRTYINENSTLVIETNENGIIKRYLIPNSLVHHSKWKKRGTKLHIYNDHVFIAKHLSGSTICKVCQKYLTRRPGKQGYECRGCNLQCHKSCHVKIENYCSNSSINSMEVEYIHDPKGETPKSV